MNYLLQFTEKYYNSLHNTIHEGNKYHLEKDVWTHTMMVYNEATPEYKKIALLHDIGKPLAETWKDGRKTFTGHEGISTILAISELNTEEMLESLYIINHHGIFMKTSDKKLQQYFKYNSTLYSKIKEFHQFDKAGNISVVEFKEHIDVIPEEFNKTESNKEVIFMGGLPNSGKSTYIQNNFSNYKIISRDNTLMNYGLNHKKGKSYSEIWQNLSQEEHKEIDRIVEKSFQEALRNGENIVIDMTLLSFKSRRKWLSKIKKDYIIRSYFLLETFETIFQRNDQRYKETGKNIPKEVIYSMTKNIQLPLLGEGFDEVHLIVQGDEYELKSY